MNAQSSATTVGEHAFNHAATPETAVAVAGHDEGDTMATGGTSKRTPATKAAAKQAAASETVASGPATKPVATPARKAAAKASPAKKVAKAGPASQAPAELATANAGGPATEGDDLRELMAKLPPAGEDVDPKAKGPRSFHITERTLLRARAAVHWLAVMSSGSDEPDTVSELAEQGLRREVERLERTYNGGRPVPAIQGRMRPGPGAQGAKNISAFQETRRRHKAGGGGGDGDA